jgi:hypothetical protein
MSDLIKLDKVRLVNGVGFVITSSIEGDAELEANLSKILDSLYDEQRLSENGIYGNMLAEKGDDAPDEDLIAYYVMEASEDFTEDYLISVSSISWVESAQVLIVNAYIGYPDDVSEWGD